MSSKDRPERVVTPQLPTELDEYEVEIWGNRLLWMADWCKRVEARLIKEGKLPPEGLVL